MTNDDLAKVVETNDEWISQRTGISKRHVLSSGESIVGHATASCQKALEMAGVNVDDVDMIIMSTSSPEDLFGSATTVRPFYVATQLCSASCAVLLVNYVIPRGYRVC